MTDMMAEMQLASEDWSPQRVLAWAFDSFGDNVAISSAFGAEGMVLIDMASRLRKDFRVFTVDTEFLFPETYSLIDKIEQKYKIEIERVYSLLSPDRQEQIHGPALWSVDPDQCCCRSHRLALPTNEYPQAFFTHIYFCVSDEQIALERGRIYIKNIVV